ncbi:baseplate J/gp47 family protein [Neisseriaceae bacterium JH1-16]|nr:baseplate J/gp47 family protein [Neisseriaceae bacterium JH1-16]
MPFAIPPYTSLRDTLLRDLKNQLPDADIGPDSDFFVRASATANAVEGLYQHQSWLVRQIFPDSADRDYLELHARVRGLARKPAVAAQGTLRLNGTPGAKAPAGIAAKLGSQRYTTSAAATLDAAGSAVVTAQADLAGVAGNADPDSPLDLTAAPAGFASQARIVAMSGGVDEESDAELLARLLELIRRPPAGGNRADYRRWALETPGVSAAYVYPLRRGLGTVDVVVTAAGDLPSPATLAAVQAHIDELRPVTAKNCLVLAPTPKVVDVAVNVELSGLTLAAAQAQIAAGLADYFTQLAPGDSAIRSRLEALVSDISGVVDRQLLQPSANVKPVSDETKVEWVRLGRVTVSLIPKEDK